MFNIHLHKSFHLYILLLNGKLKESSSNKFWEYIVRMNHNDISIGHVPSGDVNTHGWSVWQVGFSFHFEGQ